MSCPIASVVLQEFGAAEQQHDRCSLFAVPDGERSSGGYCYQQVHVEAMSSNHPQKPFFDDRVACYECGYKEGDLAEDRLLKPEIKIPVSYTHLTLPTNREV